MFLILLLLSVCSLSLSGWRDSTGARLSSKNNSSDRLCVIYSRNAFLLFSFPLSQSCREFIYSVFSDKQVLQKVPYREQRRRDGLNIDRPFCLHWRVVLYRMCVAFFALFLLRCGIRSIAGFICLQKEPVALLEWFVKCSPMALVKREKDHWEQWECYVTGKSWEQKKKHEGEKTLVRSLSSCINDEI